MTTSASSAKKSSRWNGAALAAVTALAVASSSFSWAQAPAEPQPAAEAAGNVPSLFDHWMAQFEIGGRNFDLSGDRPGKFLEYRDVRKGVYVRGLNLSYLSSDSPYMFSFRGSNILELDETC